MYDFTLTKMGLIKLAGEMYITAMRDKKKPSYFAENATITVQVVNLFLVNTICNYKINIDGIHVFLSK